MHITASEVQMAAKHQAERQRTLEVSSTTQFRQILAEQAESQNADKAGERERLARMLQQLVDTIMAAIGSRSEGSKCRLEAADCRPVELPPARPQREISWQYSGREVVDESETLNVCGSGSVKTADGRCINFDLNMNMSRSSHTERVWEQEGSVVLHDPLVLNFGGTAAELTNERIDFDINSDGKAECVAGLGSGCGYLVLDKNGNGRADDGSELFGASSGDGFSDLAKYDSDGNGWIDESDPVYRQLSVWRGGKGANELSGLKAADVGAIWLGKVDSPFAFKDGGQNLLGELRATGLWLSESGRANSVQQVDLAEVSREAAADQSHSQAAPRTPEESPWTGESKRVNT